jgi:hypothetical protein
MAPLSALKPWFTKTRDHGTGIGSGFSEGPIQAGVGR